MREVGRHTNGRASLTGPLRAPTLYQEDASQCFAIDQQARSHVEVSCSWSPTWFHQRASFESSNNLYKSICHAINFVSVFQTLPDLDQKQGSI